MQSNFGKALANGELDLPEDTTKLPGCHNKTPVSFVGDEAFQLNHSKMRPYSGRNLDIQKEYITIKNNFGILWRVFRKPICFHPNVVLDEIVMATVYLHNFLRKKAGLHNQMYIVLVILLILNFQMVRYYPVNGELNRLTKHKIEDRPLPTEIPLKRTNNETQFPIFFLTTAGEVSWQNEYEYVKLRLKLKLKYSELI